jgi:hypothetical protein
MQVCSVEGGGGSASSTQLTAAARGVLFGKELENAPLHGKGSDKTSGFREAQETTREDWDVAEVMN